MLSHTLQCWERKAAERVLELLCWAALSGTSGRTAGWLQQDPFTGIYLQTRGLPGSVCQKGQCVTGIVIRNVFVAHDSVVFGALKVQTVKPREC